MAEITATDAVDEHLDPLAPVVGTLIKRFLDTVPDGHRRALEVCALARATTEALLRAVTGASRPAPFGHLA